MLACRFLLSSLLFSLAPIASALPQALPSNADKNQTSIVKINNLCLPITNATSSSNVNLATFSARANDFCRQLGGEGMFGSKSIIYEEPLMELSFERANSGSSGEKCGAMNGEVCLAGFGDLALSCSLDSKTQKGEKILQGQSSYTTACGTYSLNLAPVVVPLAEPSVTEQKGKEGAAGFLRVDRVMLWGVTAVVGSAMVLY